jgi:hypothetical protein
VRGELEGEPKNSMGIQRRVLDRVISIQSCILSMVESLGINGRKRSGRREGGRSPRFEEEDLGEMIEEREERG